MNLYLGIAGVCIIILLFFLTDPFSLFQKNREEKKPNKKATIYDFEQKLKDKENAGK